MTKIVSDYFGSTKEGLKVTRYTLTNKSGANVKILDLGGTITEINVPDKDGNLGDVTLGFDNVSDYEEKFGYFGAINGRVANRIAGGQFTLDGVTYNLCINYGPNALHGGKVGFDKKIWEASVKEDKLVLKYVSADGEENYPGELTVTVVYGFDDDNKLSIDYTATTTKATPINLSNHAFYNIAGHGTGHLNGQTITMYAETYLPLDEHTIPTGEIRPVAGTEYDLRQPVDLGERVKIVSEGRGFDTNFCLDNNGALKLATRFEHKLTGRFLDVYTTEPGMQFYTSYLMANMKGKGGVDYGPFAGYVLEAQHYPDSVNKPQFPNSILRPGETYTQKTIYHFGLL
ncbi:LOW QUALITY PROTEIN: galactose mutarotase-like [Physella acuta]|uniref:LOW QUALITY PROTEIN: galactose mutarotase-like n=1 Tax=Physella acuta TaxID=109671 RepID=UPI0027DDC732|nr:LOW QUALITY PROTEIN: galactose mutarotase-like [Physella acuta]